MTAKSFGVDFAHQIGLGHEQTEDNDCFNKIMGANNSDYGAYVLGADPNVTNCYDAAKEAVNNGKLITY